MEDLRSPGIEILEYVRGTSIHYICMDVHISAQYALNIDVAPSLLSCSIFDIIPINQLIVFLFQISVTSDGGLSPRHAALKSGVPQESPVLGVNRLCGSGFQAVVNSAQVPYSSHIH